MRSRRGLLPLSLALASLPSCSRDDHGDAPAAERDARAVPEPSPLIAERPYHLALPAEYSPDTAAPLVLLLHGYGVDGLLQAVYFGLLPAESPMDGGAQSRGPFILAYPDGTLDSTGRRFWNATDACCDREATGVDDVAYLSAVIQDVRAHHRVDPRRIYVLGHSNGAFMAHRLACERADDIAAIFAFAGAQWLDPSRCNASAPVNVVVMHGDADATIQYGGGSTSRAAYPSASETARTWAAQNGCTGDLVTDGRKDLVDALEGPETRVERVDGCPTNGEVALWTIEGGEHIPALAPSWPDELWTYLDAHGRE